MPDETKPESTNVDLERTPDFLWRYADHTRFESNVFDFKITFGQSDQSGGKEVIRQHTAITLPWPQVRMLMYFLRINLAFHEAENGRIPIPPSQIPQEPTVPDTTAPNFKLQQAVYEAVVQLRSDLIEGKM
jgi:hypothetical protein